MYKVFYNERTVFFIKNDQNISQDKNSIIHSYKNKKLLVESVENFRKNTEINNLYIISDNIDLTFKTFITLYEVIEAAGGLVKTPNNEVLVIFRRNKWDLPKGKIEKKEKPELGAIREVEEECGITNLELTRLIEITYHTYQLKNKDILKRTYWYEMLHQGDEDPKPQYEEEITEAKWLKTNNLNNVVNNTFPSIIDVLKKGKIIN